MEKSLHHATADVGPFARYPNLKERTVLITGGASGIGERMVEAFSRQQAQVIFLDIHDESAFVLVERLSTAAGRPPVYVHCDLTDFAALKACLGEIVDQFGAFDVVINNAGDDTRHATEDVTLEFWERCLAVNLKQQFFVSQAIIPGMKLQARGVILNMSSISWMIPATGLPVYTTGKAAIVGLTRALAHELGPHGIRVNCILPGAIATERQIRQHHTATTEKWLLQRQALKRIIQPEDVARLALFLAADDSSGITNQSFVIDGGWV